MGLFSNLKALFGAQQTESSTASQPSQSTDNTAAVSTGDVKKVVIVEDEKVLADALAIKFEHENFQVSKAENGQAGLDLIKQVKPNVVLLDLMMPVMDGKTMLHKLREIEEFKWLPVVVLTNAGEVDNIRQTKNYDNASAFLIKSNINPEDVIKVVKELLRM